MQKKVRKPPNSRQLTDFGFWVKQQLLLQQMTSVELCRRVGIGHKVYLSRILHGDVAGTKYIDKIIEELDGSRKGSIHERAQGIPEQ